MRAMGLQWQLVCWSVLVQDHAEVDVVCSIGNAVLYQRILADCVLQVRTRIAVGYNTSDYAQVLTKLPWQL